MFAISIESGGVGVPQPHLHLQIMDENVDMCVL